jgi:uncharacterized phage-associated protein
MTCQFSAIEIAKFFLFLAKNDAAGDLISNLKIQKLVYYSQGIYLGLFNEKLFYEEVEAWTHGPVVKELYFFYKDYGSGALPYPEQINQLMFDDHYGYLERVYTIFGQFSAWKLRAMTHQEKPWMATPRGQVIKVSLLKSFFCEALNSNPLLRSFGDFKVFNKVESDIESKIPIEKKEVVPPPIPYINHLYNTGEIGEKTRDKMIKERIDHELKFRILQKFYLATQ